MFYFHIVIKNTDANYKIDFIYEDSSSLKLNLFVTWFSFELYVLVIRQ